jgi:hypothetical protein
VRFLSLAFLLAAGAGFAEGPKAVYLELQPVDEEVSRSVSQGITQGLAKELEKSFSLLPPAQAEALAAGKEKEPDISEATAQLDEARKLLGNVQFKQAFKKLATARSILEPLRPQLRDYTQLTTALLYTAVVAMNLGDKRTSANAFADLARLRPDFRIDSAEFPPAVVEAFEKARQYEAKQPRGRMNISSTPAGAQVFIDEVPRGQTPLTVPGSPGEHVIRLQSNGYLSWTKLQMVDSYGKHEVKAELTKNVPQESLLTLRNGAATGAAPEALIAAAGPVNSALGTDGIVVGTIAISVKGFVVSAAWLPKAGTPQVMTVDIARKLDDQAAKLSALGGALAKAAQSKEAPTKEGALIAQQVGDGKLSRAPEYEKYGLGYAPGGAAAVLAELARTPTGPLGGTQGQVTQKPGVPVWVWVGIGVLAAGAAAGATGIYFATRPPSGVQFVLQKQ